MQWTVRDHADQQSMELKRHVAEWEAQKPKWDLDHIHDGVLSMQQTLREHTDNAVVEFQKLRRDLEAQDMVHRTSIGQIDGQLNFIRSSHDHQHAVIEERIVFQERK